MTYRQTGTAYKLARQERRLKWLANNGPVYDPEKYPVPLEDEDTPTSVVKKSGLYLLNNICRTYDYTILP